MRIDPISPPFLSIPGAVIGGRSCAGTVARKAVLEPAAIFNFWLPDQLYGNQDKEDRGNRAADQPVLPRRLLNSQQGALLATSNDKTMGETTRKPMLLFLLFGLLLLRLATRALS